MFYSSGLKAMEMMMKKKKSEKRSYVSIYSPPPNQMVDGMKVETRAHT